MSELPVANPTFPTPTDLDDIQGDVILGIPKRKEDFIFFTITYSASFKVALNELIPAISTTAQIKALRLQIDAAKARGSSELIKVIGTNIAFTHKGLEKLGVTEHIGIVPDPANPTLTEPFEDGQFRNAQALGDKGTTIEGAFVPDWFPEFKGEIDGLVLVSGDCTSSVDEGVNAVQNILGDSIQVTFKISGNVRPGDQKGHEHFGFLDGISSPAIDALTGHLPGQLVVDPGNLLCGQLGDRIAERPAWTKNGSFLVYRHLEQLVPEFNKFLADNPIDLPGLPRDQGSELLGARFVGRWKSGAPIEITPLIDDPELAKDPLRNNWFDFLPNDSQTKCPFAAHIRKTRPRNDLPEDAGKQHAIARSGIPFGPEVTAAEAESNKTAESRGLSFVSYQSSLMDGFEFIQKSWCNNTRFPFGKTNPDGTPAVAGFDPIVGQNGNLDRTVSGMNRDDPAATLSLPDDFVVSRGGAYFFTPSLTALRTVLTA